MVGDEALRFAFLENVEFFAIDRGHNFGGEKIVGIGRMGKKRVSYLRVPSQRIAFSKSWFCTLLAKILSPWPMFM